MALDNEFLCFGVIQYRHFGVVTFETNSAKLT
jgi:hypothetical protein